MSEPIVYGFPRSTFVNIVRLVLTHKEVSYTFHDLEPEMGKPSHLALHPFNRVPIFRHDDFTLYETSAIVTYIDEMFEKPALRRSRAGMFSARRARGAGDRAEEAVLTIQFCRVMDHRRSKFRTTFEISCRVDATLDDARERCQCLEAAVDQKRQARYRGWAR